jgi:hypothetical protein
MTDYTYKAYLSLIETLKNMAFSFQTFETMISNPVKRTIVLRHDVDKNPWNSVRFAEMEGALGIKASYHFRIVKESFDVDCINRIVEIGHEIAYHYEIQDENFGEPDSLDKAYSFFCKNLEALREHYPVKIISMHGNPKSGFDSRKLWKSFDYHSLGIICEPYFDIDYSDVLYLTDTGRSWNGSKFNLRDKAFEIKENSSEGFKDWIVKPVPGSLMNMTPISESLQKKFRFRSTAEIINSVLSDELPSRLIINTHPQRWNDEPLPWLREFVWQNVKNTGKYFLIQIRQDRK